MVDRFHSIAVPVHVVRQTLFLKPSAECTLSPHLQTDSDLIPVLALSVGIISFIKAVLPEQTVDAHAWSSTPSQVHSQFILDMMSHSCHEYACLYA
ncbi:unnamed protein product [Protopolystoma xenopodis]|uniref:Uncharacterized protein n=1 Tax=Protopolystoma xenopodis TaxID=117903 RepID=A0A448WLI6_9PLAT|nr:unnamed protein product [Protopolystoma xenopodis]